MAPLLGCSQSYHVLGGIAMQVRCQICGTVSEVEVWTKEYQLLKYSPDHPYICHTCQQKIQVEAKQGQKP